MALVLIGFMGAGKSSAARELAAAWGVTPLDSDTLVTERLGHSIAEEFERHGEESFRAMEEAVVCRLLAGADERAVISLGGGSVLSERVREALTRHTTVWLDVDPASCWERVANARVPGQRPLAADREAFFALHLARRDLYEQVSDAIIVAPVRGTLSRVAASLSKLAGAPGTRLLWARSSSGEYPVFLGTGLLGDGRALALWPLDRDASRAFLVSDENVLGRYGSLLGTLAGSVAIPPGEAHKTIAEAERVWQQLLGAQLTRADHVVALGGGVVGDLAGFCAATYQRGIAHVQVPTSLVAQVDSAYGGKTGVDLPAAKNYVGAYHQPAGVMVDPATLATLPAAELAAGWVEVLKTALIAGGWLWEAVSAGREVDERMIFACARTKLQVVAADERDGGLRQVLNLGHTVGHAIETSTGYGRYRHGEAVGLGLLAALRLSGQDGLRSEVLELLRAHGLPVQLSGAPAEEVLAVIANDKKRLGPEVPFVLVTAPGEVHQGCSVPDTDVRAAVQELAA
jgi:shikimate kinase/3-dehydroquinate synthase